MRELSGRRLLFWGALTLALACRTPPPPTPSEPPPEEQSALGQVTPPDSHVGYFTYGERLMMPSERNSAWCELVRQGRYHGGEPQVREDPSEGCNVLHVVPAPQRNGSKMYVVFHDADPEVFPLAGPGVPKGPFSLVSGDDLLVPIFANANALDWDDALFDHDGEGHLAIAHTFPSGPSGSPWHVQTLNIVPVTPEQRPILSLMVGPPFIGFMAESRRFTWAWQLRQPPEGGPPVIELGPRAEDGTGVAKVMATFRFDSRSGRYEGPAGSAEEGFLRTNRDGTSGTCCKEWWKTVKDWAYAFVRSPASLDAPLRLRVEPQRSEVDFREEVQWPAPADASPVLIFRAKTRCALRSVTFQHEGWKARVAPPRLETSIPRQALRDMSDGEQVKYELRDACGAIYTGSFPVP